MAATPDDPSVMATGAPEPRADQIQYLTPTPPGYAPEYDYLSVVQLLIDTAVRPASDSYHSLYLPPDQLLKVQEETSCRAHLVNRSGLIEWNWAALPTEITIERMYKEIQYIRRKLTEDTHGDDCILVVDRINLPFLQILGAAIDLDPTFLWRHHNARLKHPFNVSEMNFLRSRFFSLVAAGNKRRLGTEINHASSIASSEEDRSIHITHEFETESSYPAYGISTHISCYRSSMTNRLILTRTATHGTFSKYWLNPTPFSPHVMLRCSNDRHTTRLPLSIAYYLTSKQKVRHPYQNCENPGNGLKNMAEEVHDAFRRVADLLKYKRSNFVRDVKVSDFDFIIGNHTDPLTAKDFGIVLQWLLTVSAWRANIRAFDHWLGGLSIEAVSNPSLKTFRPIPTLRKNVADLRYSLQREEYEIEDEARAAFAEFQKIVEYRVESLDSVLGTLLKDSEALIAKASNEMQMVIGSVTIQDSDMMKRQSRRATLLTLLAAFYLPLTLVTGIFGMNIAEFDVEKPSFYLCFEALFAVVAVTAIFYGLYRYLPLVFRTPRKREGRSPENSSRIHRCLYITSTPFRKIYHAFLWLEDRRKQAQEDVELTDLDSKQA